MGLSESQPQETDKVENEKPKDTTENNEINVLIEVNAEDILTHEKYEELTYNQPTPTNRQQSKISPSSFYEIALCHFPYCQSIYDIIRQVIREESIKIQKNQKDYDEYFSFSDKMEYCRIKILMHCQYRNEYKEIQNENNYAPIQISYDSNDHNLSNNNEPEINLPKILQMLRYMWVIQNKSTIESINSNINALKRSKNKKIFDHKELHHIISEIMKKEYIAFVPKDDFNWKDIKSKFDNLYKRLSKQQMSCCMIFQSTKPLSHFEIDDKVLRHGICSNGTFLFLLTEQKKLFIYLLYNGLIDKLMKEYNFDESWNFDDKTILFCSQKWLYLVYNKQTYQWPISDMLNNNDINFKESKKKELLNIVMACSNGVSYSIINIDNSIQTFKADNDHCIFNKQNDNAAAFFQPSSNSTILLSNGWFFGLLNTSGELSIFSSDPNEKLVYKQDENFPKENDAQIEAATLDALSNTFLSVSYEGSKSHIYLYPYTGAPDTSFFRSQQQQNSKHKDFEEFKSRLFDILYSCAFSPTIPNNLVFNSDNLDEDITTINIWLEKYQEDENLVKSLLFLLDLNLRKHNCKDSAKDLLKVLYQLINIGQYKWLASGVLINNIDLFFDDFDDNLYKILKYILNHSSNNNCKTFNEWILKRIGQASLLKKMIIDENLLSLLFGPKWDCISEKDQNQNWVVDLLLIAQQNMIDSIVKILKNDPMNLGNADVINSLCSHVKLLFTKFLSLLKELIKQPIKSKRKIDENTILFKLIRNFVAIASPITKCCQLAILITNEVGRQIIDILNNQFIPDENLLIFIGYFDMIYTMAISDLIRGGPVYQCEIDYAWVIQHSFGTGVINMIPQDLTKMNDFFTSFNNSIIRNFINNDSEEINHLYQKMKRFKPIKEEHSKIDRIIIAAIFHHLFDDLNLKNRFKEQNEITTIFDSVRKIRNLYSRGNQNNNDQNIKGIKQSDKILANLSILLFLNPALSDYKNIPGLKSQVLKNYLRYLEQFIINNDPIQFTQVLKIIPKRIEYVLFGFERLNILFKHVNNIRLVRIIIDGISRVESFERLGYLLSHAQLKNSDFSQLKEFCKICTNLACKFNQYSILEILCTVFQTCSYIRDDVKEAMNKLSSRINGKKFVLDPFFMTVTALADSIQTLPDNFDKIPKIGQAYFFQLFYGGNNNPTLPISDINNMILDSNHKERIILNDVWITSIFTLIKNCLYRDKDEIFNLFKKIYQLTSNLLEEKKIDMSLLPFFIYGFRSILNSNNQISEGLKCYLMTIKPESKISEIFLLFAIIGADMTEFSKNYEFRNQNGRWFKFNIDNNNYFLPIPFLSTEECYDFDESEVNHRVQEIELDLKMSLQIESILKFQNVCMNDQSSLLNMMYLQSLARYIKFTDQNLLSSVKINEIISLLSKSAQPYIDYHNLFMQQSYLYLNSNNSYESIDNKLPESKYGLCRIDQFDWTHFYAYDVMKSKNLYINLVIDEEGYIIIHCQEPFIINVENSEIIDGTTDIYINEGQINITNDIDRFILTINNKDFEVEENTYIEFIAHSYDNIKFWSVKNLINSPKICNEYENNANVEYLNDLFMQNQNIMDDFKDDLNNVTPINVQPVIANIIERNGMNIFFNPFLDFISVDDKKQFAASPSAYNRIFKLNEVEMSNQFKCVVLACTAMKNPDFLDLQSSLILLKSAVVAVVDFNKKKLMKDQFPFSLENGFFNNCHKRFFENDNYESFFIAIKSLVKSQSFMNNLGKILVSMASDHAYHSLLHKKDMVFINSDQLSIFNPQENENECYLIDFPDGSKGKLEIDDLGKWMVDTPMVFLLLLWIYIENCSTSEQRINAKLALINSFLIKSPMINKYLIEFLSFMQKRLLFTPDDFNPIYIHHLSTLAQFKIDDQQIMCFYNFERNCYKLKEIKQLYLSKTFNFNQLASNDINSLKKNMDSSKFIEILLLMEKYKTIESFPYWYLIPIWKEISSSTLKENLNNEVFIQEKNYLILINQLNVKLLFTVSITTDNICEFEICEKKNLSDRKKLESEHVGNKYMVYLMINPGERRYLVWHCVNKKDIKIKSYQIIKENKISNEDFESDMKAFALKWTKNDTDELLNNDISFHLKCKNFLWFYIDTFSMTNLINEYGIRTVQCKAACLFLINYADEIYDKYGITNLNMKEFEIYLLGKQNSHLLSYYNRTKTFEIGVSSGRSNGNIYLNDDKSCKFLSGDSNNVNDSMIYQISKYINLYPKERFRNITWNIHFKGKPSVDSTGVTNQMLTSSIQSFLSPKTGICILSPNYIDKEIKDLSDYVEVIPFPTTFNNNVKNVLYAFGVILGSIIRGKKCIDIPFPLFVWNYLAGKPITKEDIYENDKVLHNEILAMKNGTFEKHWTYRNWDNSIEIINNFPENAIVSPELVDIYENIAINNRITSIEKVLVLIKKGLYDNQNIYDSSYLSGGLIMYLCQGTKKLDLNEVLKKIFFTNGTTILQQNFIKILKEYDENMMRKFLLFTTACTKTPNFAISPEYRIDVYFNSKARLDLLPCSHTCFKQIVLPEYTTIDDMRNKMKIAFDNCASLDER